MAAGSDQDFDLNDVASSSSSSSSPSPTEETTATKRQRLTTSTGTLTSPPLSSLHAPPPSNVPFDLVQEILCRLPVKTLVRFRSVCKSWNNLISGDSNFAKKHLRMTAKINLIASSLNSSDEKLLLWDSPISSVFSDSSSTTCITQTQIRYPPYLNFGCGAYVCSCNGILCFQVNQYFALLWNPSVRKLEMLPPLESIITEYERTIYGFGYDHLNDNYKVIAIFGLHYEVEYEGDWKPEVNVHTLGTNYWRRIEYFPYGVRVGEIGVREMGEFVSGTINWLVLKDDSSSYVIVSLDIGNESYQEISPPDFEGVVVDLVMLTMSVLRDCLCICAHSKSSIDVCIMKEYGNKESWTKLISVPFNASCGNDIFTRVKDIRVKYIDEDDQVLLVSKEMSKSTSLSTQKKKTLKSRLIVYDSRNGTFKIPKIQNSNGPMVPGVYIESLMSPFS